MYVLTGGEKDGWRREGASVVEEDIDDDGSEFEEECCENGHVYICFEVGHREDSFPVDDAILLQKFGSSNI